MCCLLATPASGQWIAGVRATTEPLGCNDDLSQIDLTATVFYTTGVAFSSAFLGVTSGYGQIAPAVDWGDGSTVPPQWPGGSGIPFDTISTPPGAPGPMRVYRAQFSHVYASFPSGGITVNSHFSGGISPALVFTGNIETAPTPTYSIFGGIRTFLVNTTSIAIPACEEIDTVSDSGLLALALALAAAGMFLLRRLSARP